MASVAISDLGDGSGATAVVSGTAGAPWILYTSRIPCGYRQVAFEATSSGTGDSTVTLELSTGPYLCVLACDGVPSGPKPFRVTDEDQGTHYKCLAAIRDMILTLAIPLVPRDEARHKLRKVPAFTIKDFGENPEGVHYWMLPERPMYADNGHERTIYPVQVAFVQGNLMESAPDYRWTLGRQLARLHATGKALPGAPEIDVVTVLPGVLYPEDAFAQSLDQHSLIFECQTDELFRQ